MKSRDMAHQSRLSELREFTHGLALEAREDVVGFWQILRWPQAHVHRAQAEEFFAVVTEILSQLLHEERLLVGQFEDLDEVRSVFVPWEGHFDQIVERILQGWRALGRDPDPGDVCWFADSSILPVTTFRDRSQRAT